MGKPLSPEKIENILAGAKARESKTLPYFGHEELSSIRATKGSGTIVLKGRTFRYTRGTGRIVVRPVDALVPMTVLEDHG